MGAGTGLGQSAAGGMSPSELARLEYLENNEYKVTYFASISSNSGTITKPTGSTIILDGFMSGVDALVETIANGQPTGYSPVTSGGAYVTVSSFDTSGNYTLSGTPSATPVALIYILKIPADQYQNLDLTKVITAEPVKETPGNVPHTTASGTDTYTATVNGVSAYNDGDAYLVRFTNGNTTGCTLNINSLGAKTLYRNNDGVLLGGDIIAGAEMLCVYNSTLGGFQTIGTAPNTLLAYVTNAEGSTITKGQAVYTYSGTGDRVTVKLANNTADATSDKTLGIVLSTSIAANQKGFVIIQGQLDGLSIFPTATYSDGDSLYLGATAGAITKVKPSAPNRLVHLGTVTTASNGSAGIMYVSVQNGFNLEELHNVSAQSPSDKDGIFYNSGTGLWEKKSIATNLGYTPEDTANKSSSYTASSTTTYANTKALVDGLATKVFHIQIKGLNSSPADATSYYFALDEAPNTNATLFRYYPTSNIVITKATVLFTVTTTLGTTETSTIAIRVDNTTDYNISTSTKQDATQNLFTNTSMNVPVNVGSYFNIKWTTPTWATNPTNIQMIVILEATNA